MTYEEALAWCIEHMAQVTFFDEQYQHRVTVRAAGFPHNTATRNSFVEAVEATKQLVERAERAQSE